MATKSLIVNKSICSGCRLCELVCSEFHEDGEINPSLSRVIITKKEEIGQDIPGICSQCKNAPCATVCPVKAISHDQNIGAWIVDKEVCTGCGLCVKECPFDAIHIHPKMGVAYKCDLCGGDPQCVKVCNLSALKYE